MMQNKSKKSSILGGIEYTNVVKIPFQLTFGHEHEVELNAWNECCARAIELFGNPGDKYSCKFSREHIEFWFKDEKDALMFELCCG